MTDIKKSKNVDDYITNPDEELLKEERKKPLVLIGAGVCLIAGLGAYTYIASHPVVKEKPVFTEVNEQQVSDSSKDSKGFSIPIPGLNTEKKKVEKDLTLPRYVNKPSSEILNADPLSGEVQIGEWIFSLPCKLTAFTDAGLKIYALGPDEKDVIGELNDSVANTTFSKLCEHTVIVSYDEYSRYALFTYDEEDVSMFDATVHIVRQSEQASYFDDRALPMFIPGGLHCGSSLSDCENAFTGDPKLAFNATGNLYTYNGPVDFPYKPNNLIYFWYDDELEECGEVEVYKNY